MQGKDIKAISARLKELRTFSDYSTKEVADKLGIDEEEYVAYETGEQEIPINLIYKFASIMETEPSYVISGTMPSGEKVNVVYDGKGKFPGKMKSAITIRSNAKNRKVLLFIEGNMTGK